VLEKPVESVALHILSELQYKIKLYPKLISDEVKTELILMDTLADRLIKLNPGLPADCLKEAIRVIKTPEEPSLVRNNKQLHKLLVEGVPVRYRKADRTIDDYVKLIDFDHPDNNDWQAISQMTVIEGQHIRRPDVVIYVNGIPLAVIEVKNPSDEKATIWTAYNQLQTYMAQIPSLFVYNALLVVTDGIEARVGTISSGREWMMPWREMEVNSMGPPSSEGRRKELDSSLRWKDETGKENSMGPRLREDDEKMDSGLHRNDEPRNGTLRQAQGDRKELDSSLRWKDETRLTSQMEVLLKGIFEPSTMLNLIRYFIVFEQSKDSYIKKMAGYHQYHAVNVAVEKTVEASSAKGDKRCGVVWHTQGSGKSLTMAFYAGRIIQHPTMENPTIVVLTDRNDLDDQLFRTFASCKDLIRQTPKQAEDRQHLKHLLKVASGGVIFTTIQKFLPEDRATDFPRLSERRNIVVIADEAHRSQYDFIDGFAKHMRDALPNASFIAFTGTPIELTDRNTQAVFGNYISIYDIQQAVLDNATVPIYYESRLAKLELIEAEKPHLDTEFEEITEGKEPDEKQKLKSKWAALEAVVGAEKRIKLIAEDLLKHWTTRLEIIEGKALIVCMSRRICVEMYSALSKLRPDWVSANDKDGVIKIVMTGSPSDPLSYQPHIRSKERRDLIAERFKNPTDKLKIVIVRDMWLTGFDVPCLHTMYVDKPMHGHGLMQAIARVNRVYKDKPGGLIVDYLGLADELKKALAVYTQSGGKDKVALDQEEAVAQLVEFYEQCLRLFDGFDWTQWLTGTPKDKLNIIAPAQEFILKQEDGKTRLLETVAKLTKAFALSVPHPKALELREAVAFFQTIKAALVKSRTTRDDGGFAVETAIRQLVSKAISSDEVIDIFAAAGLKKPNISILSDEFLADVKNMPYRNLAVELLQKLLKDEIKSRFGRNAVQARTFSEMLMESIRKYQNRAIETAQVIEELIALAKDIRSAQARGEKLKLTDDEVAFYDALETSDSAVQVLGDDTLKTIARELVETVKKNVTIDWAIREQARAKLRVMVKRILRKYGYPPDKQEKATDTVLEQAELICGDLVA
jgi:type I restriction enzyme R subunit